MDLQPTVLSSLFIFLITAALLYNRAPKKITKQPRPDETRRKGPVFRVTGVPASQPDDVLHTTLRATIEGNLSKEEKLKPSIAIVPSCYEPEHERVALVEFGGGVPAFLSKLVANPLEKYQDEIGDTDISFDCHFFGFTQLYTPEPDTPVTADIIAITGLDGHAYGSWRGKGNLGRMWLRDFLSKDLPCCRTMIYGYNSKLSTHGVDTIMDYGRGLMEELKKVRNTEELRKRPLFFIAHSFGGIILAHCLVKAIQADEDDHPTVASLYKATYGMLLFGIPHKGLVVDDIQKMLAGKNSHPRDVLLQEIRSKSNLLAYQLVDFKNLIRDRKIVSFYETGQTRQLTFDSESKRWKRAGDFVTAVETDSALLQLPEHMEEKIPLDADHSMIVKFDGRNDRGYTSARDKLRQFERDAPGVVAARFLRAQNRPKPSIMVPFQRDSTFVGREDVLTKIREKLEQPASQGHSRLALVGLGGIGKSQIAIEYAYRVRESTPQTWVFWVHASNAVRFEQAYRDIAAKVELPGRDDPKADMIRLVHNWLCDERNGRWLMVLDNADDDDVFFSADEDTEGTAQTSEAMSQKRPLANFLPQTPNGSILITSRNSTAASSLVEPHGSTAKVEPMGVEDALALLKTRVSISGSEEDDAKALVQALECIPLAIAHAAAYVKTRAPITTIASYLRLFRESEANQARLLDAKELRDLRRDPSIKHAVIATWKISFDQIQKTGPAAAELLALMSMFDRQGIPVSLLQGQASRLDFEDAVAPLLSFSLVRVEIGQQSFEMHRLVQLSTRTWLEANDQLDGRETESIRILAKVFPSGEYKTWVECRQLLPHSRKVLSYVREEREAALGRARIAVNTGWYLFHTGEYAAAADFTRDAMVARDRLLGAEHPDTLTSVSNLGSVLESQGKYEEAEAMHRRALTGREKALGPEHPDTLTSVGNLGWVLESQGKYEEAEAMHRRDLAGREKALGPEHPDTLTSVGNLGSVLESQGKYEEAEAMHRRDLAGSEKVLGPEHPDTLISVGNLGSVLSRQGKYKEAEAIHRRALTGREKALRPEHPDTLTSVSNLGSVLSSQGKYEEAEAMHRRALTGREKVLGPEHPDTLTSVGNLGSVLSRQGKYKEAEAMHRRALTGREKALGPEHPNTLTSMASLASTFWSQSRLKEAEDLEMRVMETRKRVLGDEHPATLTAISNLAFTLKSQSRSQEAMILLQTCVQMQTQVLGGQHPDTESSLETLSEWEMESIELGH